MSLTYQITNGLMGDHCVPPDEKSGSWRTPALAFSHFSSQIPSTLSEFIVLEVWHILTGLEKAEECKWRQQPHRPVTKHETMLCQSYKRQICKKPPNFCNHLSQVGPRSAGFMGICHPRLSEWGLRSGGARPAQQMEDALQFSVHTTLSQLWQRCPALGSTGGEPGWSSRILPAPRPWQGKSSTGSFAFLLELCGVTHTLGLEPS